MDKNVFMFTFGHEVDVRRIWDCGPWSFKGEHLILKQYSSDLSFNEIDFSISDFWVQVHGLPLNHQNVPSLKKLVLCWVISWIRIFRAVEQMEGRDL